MNFGCYCRYKAAIKADPLCYEVLLVLYSIDFVIMKSFGANLGGVEKLPPAGSRGSARAEAHSQAG